MKKLNGSTFRAALAAGVAALVAHSQLAFPAPTRVGNGDDGTDLEGAVEITSGPIVDARAKALELVRSLNAAGVSGLGLLEPEIEKSALHLASRDANASLAEDHGAFHSDLAGKVFARTFARPHAATRFFPAALALSQRQLVALHVHEALHRSLSPEIRENESAVAAITLAITSPGATHDGLAETAGRLIPAETRAVAMAAGQEPESLATATAASAGAAIEATIPETSRVHQPSFVGYSYRQFQDPSRPATFPVSSMHSIQSFLYPFGSARAPLGIGIEASLIGRPDATQMGPLSLSARLRLWTYRGFDIGGWGVASLNTLSSEELKNSPLGRDVTTLGLSMRKDLKHAYVENFLSLSFPGEATARVGSIDYTHGFGQVWNVSAHAGAALSKLKLGAYAEIALADYYRVNGGAFAFDSGRYRILSAGPELSWLDRDFSVTLAGRFLLDSTRDASFDYLGNIMGQGVSQGNVSATVGLYF